MKSRAAEFSSGTSTIHSFICSGGEWGCVCVEKQRHYSANKGPYSQRYGLPSGHIGL